MKADAAFISVTISCDSETQAHQLGRALVETKLAACAQIHPVRSIYAWQGELAQDDEILLAIKTSSACFEALRRFIRENHSYDTPQITATPICNVDPDYAAWLRDNTSA